MKIAKSLLLGTSLLLVSAHASRAVAESMGRSWLPFLSGSSKSDVKVTKVSNNNSSPGVVANLSNGTKSFVTSTKNMLTPGKPQAVRKSGKTGVQVAKGTKPEKPGFFKSMFNSEPPPPPKTIKEWMSLKQIHP